MITGSFVRFDRRYVLLAFALGVWIWIAYSIKTHSADHIIKATIIQSKTPLRTIDSKVVPVKKETLWIDKLYFPVGNELRHPTYGYLGYKKNFVIYFDSVLDSLEDQEVTFAVYSDDGFRFWVDGKMVGEYPKDRPFRRSIVRVFLPKGEHRVRIKYFQGYGQLGIKVLFKTDKNSFKLFGTDLNTLKFVRQ